jgi:uncharacterized protein (TIGR03437 family)
MKIPGSLALKLCLCLVAAAAVAAATTPPSLSASPAAVNYQYSSGEQLPPAVTVIVTASDGSSPALTVTLTPPTGNAATLFPTSALIVSGDAISVGYDVTTLTDLLSQPGTYTASLAVNAAGFASLNIPLTFVVGGGTLSIVPSPASLTFNAPPAPTAQTITLSGASGASIAFSVASDSTWLSATAIPGYTPSTLTVTVNPLNLPGGTYHGNIAIIPTTGSALAIPVTLQIGPNTLTASPASLAFTYTVGGTTPPAQALQLSGPLSNDTYTAQAASTGNWLLVNGVTTKISGALPASLNVTVNPAGLAAGNYQGTITATDADNGTQTVTVTLVVSAISTVANPTSLVFVAEVGGAAPAAQPVAVNGFGAATYTATVTGAWLSVSPASGSAPAQLTVTANPTGLAAGTYTGKVEINLNSHIQDIQVTLIVSASPVLTTTPGGFIYNYFGGSAPPSPLSLYVNVSFGAPQSFTVAAGAPAWLKIGSDGGSLETSTTLSVDLTPQTLPTGTYLAQIILIPAGTGAVSVVVPVLLTVGNATPVVPNLTSLSFSAAAGGAPQSQTVEVTAASPTSFNATTTSAGNWLSVSPTSGNASVANTPLTVTADATNLAKGTYQGTVTLTTAGGVVTQISVTFTVAIPSGPVTISLSTLAFGYTQSGALPAAQSLQITGSQSFTASASTSGGTWLAVTPSSGTGNVSLSVSVNPAGLAPGVYNGTITVTPTGGVAQTVPVTLTVSAAGLLAAAPDTLAFAYAAGNPTPAAQTVSVTSTGQAVTFTATASSSGWLSVTQSAVATPATLSVGVNPANLGAGSYNGSIALSGGSGIPQLNISVTLTVTAPLPVIGGVVNAASYLEGGLAPGEIITIFGTALGPATGVSATIDSKGFIETTLANVTVTFNGYPGPILYASAGQVNAIVPYELAGASNVSIEAVFGSARSNSVALPVVASAPGIFSANASGQGPGAILDLNYHLVSASNPVSGGCCIQIFATGQGQTSPGSVDGLIEPLTLPLPAPLLAAKVTIGGVTANIQYVGAAPGLVAGALQVNAIVPDGLPSGPAPLVVSFGGVDFSQPGITVAIK